MKQNKCSSVSVIALAAFCLAASMGEAATNNVVGSFNLWPTAWTPILSLNDGVDAGVADKLDFVGNNSFPGAYWANTNGHVFFRMRLHEDANPSFTDSHFVLIDIVGQGTNIDYGFAWDSQNSAKPEDHGLEMMVPETLGNTWRTTRMDDLDGNEAKKLAVDINGGGRTTDGYVRWMDGQVTTDSVLGTNTFIDFAVSWSYLNSYTGLTSNQTWKIALASVSSANDHNWLNTDIAGNANPDSAPTTGWSDPVAIPEPSTGLFVGLGLVALMIVQRIHRPTRRR